jgi:ferredoxin
LFLFDQQYKIAATRGRIYSLLAMLYRHPLRHPEPDKMASSICRAASDLSPLFPLGRGSLDDFQQTAVECLRAWRGESVEARTIEYYRLFGTDGAISLDDASMQTFLSSPFLTDIDRQKSERSASGEVYAEGASQGRILSELEFLQCMIAAESECIMDEQDDSAGRCRQKQLAFLRGHLLARFANLHFLELVSGTSDFYRLLIAATHLFCNVDAGYLSRLLKGDAVACPNDEGFSQGMHVSIDAASCSLCAACVQACLKGALAMELEGDLQRLTHLQARCQGCRVCARTCPENALTIDAGGEVASERVTLIEGRLARCPRCGRADDLAALSNTALGRLGGDVSDDLRAKLSYCRRCRTTRSDGRREDVPAIPSGGR